MSLLTKKSPIERTEIFAALDIGTTKICCAIAKIDKRSFASSLETPTLLKVIGVGQQLSRGLRAGNIVDLEALEDSILNAVHSAEQASGQSINSVYVNLPGISGRSKIIRSEIQLFNAPVDDSHLRRLLSYNQSAPETNDRQVIHVLPLSYTLDTTQGIRDPRGMVGEKLSALLHVVSAPINLIRNIKSCIGKCHLDISGFVASGYASGLSTLVEDELELGVTVIDMGGGTTTIASFCEGNLTYLSSFPLGGANITNDIARGLATPLAHAERLKNLYGTLVPSQSDDRESILVSQMGEIDQSHAHQVPKGMLTHIIKARVEEIAELIVKSLKESTGDSLTNQRIVLTGGASQMQGLRELVMQALGKQVRLGAPVGLVGSSDIINNPTFSTCAGLLQYGLQDRTSNHTMLPKSKFPTWQRFGLWLRESFE
ncbi:MAG: cell division protein FtsA [Alphaproteobacteria bacterium]|nr:cell division protein FtsA [Alphaproteobacteria bacterium]